MGQTSREIGRQAGRKARWSLSATSKSGLPVCRYASPLLPTLLPRPQVQMPVNGSRWGKKRRQRQTGEKHKNTKTPDCPRSDHDSSKNFSIMCSCHPWTILIKNQKRYSPFVRQTINIHSSLFFVTWINPRTTSWLSKDFISFLSLRLKILKTSFGTDWRR